MRVNENVLIEGRQIVLVPYKEHHVLRYNSWMQSTELQKLTASEPLSLQQEYDMQKSWHLDENKCTFIILQKEKWEKPEFSEIDCMCGDVNLYFIDPDDSGIKTAEIEVMIAEPSCRRQGIGREALMLMMQYGISKLLVRRFVAKIGLDNQPSLALFNKLGFREESVSEVFSEVTLHLDVTDDVRQSLGSETEYMMYRDYVPKR